MTGIVTKGVGGLYTVFSEGNEYSCKPKGLFRKDNTKVLVGDKVELQLLADGTGLITEIHKRITSLIRPEVANATQAMLVFAVNSPEPNLALADRFLIAMEKEGIRPFIVFNKCDIATDGEIKRLKDIYSPTGYDVFFVSGKENKGIDKIRKKLKGQTTVPAGPSGVGKSTIINLLQNVKEMETGAISEKIARGKHTTRHSELFQINNDTWLFDTPGFTSFELRDIAAENLWMYFPEMLDLKPCRFTGCAHINEPDCSVKAKVLKGNISKTRYEDYKLFYEELKRQKKY